MAVTRHTLTGDLSSLAATDIVDTWSLRTPLTTRARVETNIPDDEPLVDTSTGGLIMVGSLALDLEADGSFTVDLPSTAATSLNWSNLRYRIVGEFPDSGTRTRGGFESPWFTLTAPRDLRSVYEAGEDFAPATPVSEIFTQMQDLLAAVEALKDQVEEALNIDDSDSAQAYNIEHGPLTKAQLLASTVARVSRAKHAPALGVYFPEAEGAVGDGAADDGAAMQAVFTVAGNAGDRAQVYISKSYRVTRNLYGFGNVDFVGPGEIVLDADLSASDGSKFFINLGVKSKGGTNATWVGRWSANIRTTANVTPASGMRLINAHRFDGSVFEGFKIDMMATGPCKVSGIGCYNDTAWCTTPSKNRLTIRRVMVLAAQSGAIGGEGIGVGNVDIVWILDNYVYGVGDDVIGVHTCTNYEVAGNRCWSPDGRLYHSTSQNGHVHHNRNERIANPDASWNSGGALMFFQIEAIGAGACADTHVHDNTLIHAPGIVSATYGMRMRGVRRFNVHDNHVRDTSGFGYAITWEGQDTSVDAVGWTDPEGLDADGIARVRDLRVVGNYVTGGGEGRIQAMGASSTFIGPIEVHSNRPGTGGTTIVNGAAHPPPNFPTGIGLPAKSATGVPNNTLFQDSADNKLKYRDNDGTLVRVLLDRSDLKLTATTVLGTAVDPNRVLWTSAIIPATLLRAPMLLQVDLALMLAGVAGSGTFSLLHKINGTTIATSRLVNISQTSAFSTASAGGTVEHLAKVWVEAIGSGGSVSMMVTGGTRSNATGTTITECTQALAQAVDLSAGLTYSVVASMSLSDAGNATILNRAERRIVA